MERISLGKGFSLGENGRWKLESKLVCVDMNEYIKEFSYIYILQVTKHGSSCHLFKIGFLCCILTFIGSVSSNPLFSMLLLLSLSIE